MFKLSQFVHVVCSADLAKPYQCGVVDFDHVMGKPLKRFFHERVRLGAGFVKTFDEVFVRCLKCMEIISILYFKSTGLLAMYLNLNTGAL